MINSIRFARSLQKVRTLVERIYDTLHIKFIDNSAVLSRY